MARLKHVTDADLNACLAAADDALMQMQDMVHRLRSGAVDRLTTPEDHAKKFAVIARDASDMAVFILITDAMQKQRDELNRLKGEAEK
jgi:hypothetical protein